MPFKRVLVESFILIFLLILVSCNQDKKTERKTGPKIDKQEIEEINKHLINKDTEVIKNYIDRRGWDMQMSNTGLWYMIYDKGNGKPVKKGVEVSINYDVWLIDGTLCYTSDSLGIKKFNVGQGGVESGLEEGVLLLNEGSKARFIMPPHLAHGLIGDENRIPARAILIYDIEILNVNE